LVIACCPLFSLDIKHPDGFITVCEYMDQGGVIKGALNEIDSSQFVVSLENGIVVNEGGIVTKDGKIFKDTETYLEDQHRLLRGKRDISKEDVTFFNGKLAVISSPGQENWYHWLFQVLPRIKILVESGVEFDKIYIDNLKYSWQRESLAVVMKNLGLSEDCLFLTVGDSIVQASSLIVPSVAFIPSKWPVFPRWLKSFLRNTFLVTQESANRPERIYISRSKASVRRIANEEAFVEILKQQGFVVVTLEDLSVHEQADLFHQAKIVIGPHGSGFANLIFSNPETCVIEIDHGLAGEQRSFYKRMAEIMECKYFGYYPDCVEEELLDEDITINIEAFINFFRNIPCEKKQ